MTNSAASNTSGISGMSSWPLHPGKKSSISTGPNFWYWVAIAVGIITVVPLLILLIIWIAEWVAKFVGRLSDCHVHVVGLVNAFLGFTLILGLLIWGANTRAAQAKVRHERDLARMTEHHQW